MALKRGLEKGVFKMAKEEGKGSQSYKLGEKANDVLKKPKAKAKPKKDDIPPQPPGKGLWLALMAALAVAYVAINAEPPNK